MRNFFGCNGFHPYRRQIVQLLREKRKLGFKELHEALKISVGALYHHIDMLEGIVAQDSDRKYVLTDQGRSAIETLSVSEEKIAAGSSDHRRARVGSGEAPAQLEVGILAVLS